MKQFTVNADGEVIESKHDINPLYRIEAKTKTEATQKLLKHLHHVASESPRLYVRGNAFLMVHPSPYRHDFVCESGKLDRAEASGRLFGLCISSEDTISKAPEDASFNDYAKQGA